MAENRRACPRGVAEAADRDGGCARSAEGDYSGHDRASKTRGRPAAACEGCKEDAGVLSGVDAGADVRTDD